MNRLVLAVMVPLCMPQLSNAADVTRLRLLQEKSQFFQLREALQQPGWSDSETLLYRALVESRFGRETAAVVDLQKFLVTSSDRVLQRKAYEELASALVRVGRYGDSANALEEAIRLTPADDVERANSENARALYQSLADVAPETVEFGEEVATRASRNPLGSWDVPVEVNNQAAEWIFDTGANLSTLSESEAARLGLTPRDTATYVSGSTEKKNSLRLAVANNLQLGNAHLHNIVFLVLSDAALYMSPLNYQIRGILGLPVLRALGCVGISPTGEIQAPRRAACVPGKPNLFFDDVNLIVEARHGNRRLQMFLDTGANATFVYPSFRRSLTNDELVKLKSKEGWEGGVGGAVHRVTEVLPTLRLDILGRNVQLKNVDLHREQLAGSKSYRDGVLGMDALAHGFTLDFREMRLRLD